jgi:hypothetical protein
MTSPLQVECSLNKRGGGVARVLVVFFHEAIGIFFMKLRGAQDYERKSMQRKQGLS